jgi:ribosomal protein L11 methyltransferase
MRYHVAHIDLHFDQAWQEDLFVQSLFDAGFDTFDGHDAYIPSETLEANKTAIEALFATEEKAELTGIEACPDENWNAVWEAEHPIQELPLGVKIIPHCAFGAGHHETTSLLINTLLSTDLTGKNVLDHGTGTGVLAIFAKKQGAQQVIAVDIDDKSVENAKENAVLNNVAIDVRLGSTVPSLETNSLPSRSASTEGSFHLILANIHRNILLENMPAYASSLVPGGELWISGFYASDCPALISSAESHSLHHLATLSNGEWHMLRFQKQ